MPCNNQGVYHCYVLLRKPFMVFQSVFLNLKQKTSLVPCICTDFQFLHQHVLELLFMGGST